MPPEKGVGARVFPQGRHRLGGFGIEGSGAPEMRRRPESPLLRGPSGMDETAKEAGRGAGTEDAKAQREGA